MITPALMVDWATQRPGPAFKVFANQNAQSGLVCHSAEGWLAGAFGELDKTERQASWHFTGDLDGTLYQHYPLSASCWASGNFEANTKLVAVENIGVAGTPLNAAQVATMLRLAADLEEHWGFALVRQHTLWEHNEVALWETPNAGPTACPSHRYDPFFAALEEDMPDPRVDDILRALTGRDGADAATRLAAWNGDPSRLTGNSLLDGYLMQQAAISVLQTTAAPSALPAHTHGFTGETGPAVAPAVSTPVPGGTL